MANYLIFEELWGVKLGALLTRWATLCCLIIVNDSGSSALFMVPETAENLMNNIIWIVGAVVIVLVILGFLGLR